MACKNVHVIHFKKSTPFSSQKKVLHPQLKKKKLGSKPGPPPPRNQMGRP